MFGRQSITAWEHDDQHDEHQYECHQGRSAACAEHVPFLRMLGIPLNIGPTPAVLRR
jgi:hypothetical protein